MFPSKIIVVGSPRSKASPNFNPRNTNNESPQLLLVSKTNTFSMGPWCAVIPSVGVTGCL